MTSQRSLPGAWPFDDVIVTSRMANADHSARKRGLGVIIVIDDVTALVTGAWHFDDVTSQTVGRVEAFFEWKIVSKSPFGDGTRF